jgi:hypothetical protein
LLLKTGFDRNIPEDVIISALENGLEPIVQCNSELPIPRVFNDIALIMSVYAKWGVKKMILGNKPNTKAAWLEAGWQYENLIDHFLDRFIPLANHSVRIGINPVLPPMQPGGDYWDTAFIELVLKGLRQRKLDAIINDLILSCYGYTFNNPLSWGRGGPERWSVSKPYLTPEGQEDQLGFNNFEWVLAHAKRQIGDELPVMILDAGNPGTVVEDRESNKILEDVQIIYRALQDEWSEHEENSESAIVFDDSVKGCFFDLNTLENALGDSLNFDTFGQLFASYHKNKADCANSKKQTKEIPHYLLLPSHQTGVSDAVLSKVRPIIKKFKPTIGFSLKEASMAQRVTIFPDSHAFTDEQINQLRATGCSVEILPESGIEIATFLQE